jgi:hypothetical protein
MTLFGVFMNKILLGDGQPDADKKISNFLIILPGAILYDLAIYLIRRVRWQSTLLA